MDSSSDLSTMSIMDSHKTQSNEIILEWDGTLFPTWNILHENCASLRESDAYIEGRDTLYYYSINDVPRVHSTNIRRLERSVIELLETCIDVGLRPTILTGASKEWIERCLERYYTNLRTFITANKIPLLSARSWVDRKDEFLVDINGLSSTDFPKLKSLAMRSVLFWSLATKERANVIVVGNSQLDMGALCDVHKAGIQGKELNCLGLGIKSIQGPTALRDQLEHLTDDIPDIVAQMKKSSANNFETHKRPSVARVVTPPNANDKKGDLPQSCDSQKDGMNRRAEPDEYQAFLESPDNEESSFLSRTGSLIRKQIRKFKKFRQACRLLSSR